jgi:Mechanosensitive ion channel, conserved TM helix
MAGTILDVVSQAWRNYLDGIVRFLPRLLATLSILVAGWLIAAVLRFATKKLLALVRFDALAQRSGLLDVLKKAEIPSAESAAGTLVFWLLFIGFLLSGVEALGFSGLESLVADFLRFVPSLLVALAILAIGLVGANFAWRATLLAAVNASLPSARLVAAAVRLLIIVLVVAMALEQIAVAQTVVLTAFAIAFGAVMLGLAIAFGIGGSGVARRLLEQQFPGEEKRPSDGASHL